MERRGQCSKGNKHPPPRRAREERRHMSSGSFSTSLLDAIYRSLDEGDGGADAPRRRSEGKATAPQQFWLATEAGIKPRQVAGADRAERRQRGTGAARPRHSGYASSTTSSSDSSSSSSNGFSCSSASTTDTESTIHRRYSPPPPRVSEESSVAAVAAAQPSNSKRRSKSRPCFPGAMFRPRSPSQSSPRMQPPSPSTFACALKALFTTARFQRKPKTPAVPPQPPPVSPDQPQTSGVPAVSTVKAAVVPEPSERSVRFHQDADASVVRRRVEELVRGLEELEEDEEGSDSSSDLFELESLSGAGADELPVYGTTSLAANRAIAQRAAC